MTTKELADDLERLLRELDNARTVGQTKAPRERLWRFIEESGGDVLKALRREYMEPNQTKKRTTPDHITELADDEVFVFGSNDKGIHGRGAALQARLQFGAKYGVGEGLTGYKNCCYAFPTLQVVTGTVKFQLEKRHPMDLVRSADLLFRVACDNPQKTFLLTKVGCGLAGYDESFMIELFTANTHLKMPSNIVKPEGW